MPDHDAIHPIPIWLLRAAWVTLPLTAGPAAGTALRDWSDATRVTAEVLLWLAWAVGLLATVAPRPETLTVARVIAPAFFVLAIVVAIDGAPSTLATIGALVATGLVTVLASGADFAFSAVNAIAYGDEFRVPLRTPPALFLGPLPLARAVAVACIAVPPLLFADGSIALGVVAVVIAVGLLYVVGRALLGLSNRFAVLVPAGFVVVDPMTLTDPVLFLRERVVAISAADPGHAPDDVVDLRVGATLGSVSARFDEPAMLVRAARARRGGDTVYTQEIRVAVVRRDTFLRRAAGRRLRVVR
jgi:hypothetical protein